VKPNSRFRFDPGVFSRFGEELVPKPEQGIVELVKNSYDADARTCEVELIDTKTEGGEVRISDDGIGMDEGDIRDGFFVIGHSRKAEIDYTEKYDRRVAGDKGIGRLAALRLGTVVTIRTRPESEPGTEYYFTVDWTDYEGVGTVDEVEFNLRERNTDKEHGTDIHIKNLRSTLTKRNVKYLSRQLILLSDPFEGKQSFTTHLRSPQFKSFERRTNRKYFDDADYHLVSSLDEKGAATAKLVDWRGETIEVASHDDICKSDDFYNTIDTQFDLWWFILKKESFSSRQATIKEVRNWLSEVGGVHFYHGDLRVAPYGEPGHDWLQLNLARSRSPEKRPSTNNSIGRVKVSDPDGRLKQKTDRQGFIEGPAFQEIRSFCQDTVDWLSRFLRKRREERRQKNREEAPQESKDAEDKLENALEKDEKDKDVIEKRVNEYKNAKEKEINKLHKDLQLYRSLATAGVTSSTFAHQASTPLTQIDKIADLLQRQVKRKIENDDISIINKAIKKLKDFSKSLSSFASLPLNLLKRTKRRNQIVKINDVVEDVLLMFDGYFDEANIEVVFDRSNKELRVQGSIALLEAIMTNMVTNSVKAFNNGELSQKGRKFKIKTQVSRSGRQAIINVADSGPGIEDIPINEIWHPGRTSYPGGTGFGLTIVRDSVSDLGGDVDAIAHGELGGAEFNISIPLKTPLREDGNRNTGTATGEGAS
jgi:C4-dicarboxylate-specific signal transduction histidine kinase